MPKKIYTSEMRERIIELKDTYNNVEMAEVISQEFNVKLNSLHIKHFLANNKIKRNVRLKYKQPTRSIFSQEIEDYMHQNYKGVGPTEMVERINKMWGTSYTRQQVKSYYRTRGLNSGLTGRWEKGHESWCKGMAGNMPPTKYNPGRFKKGNMPVGHEEVGAIKKRVDGYWIKIAEPNKWRQYHRVVYEQCFGDIPEGYWVAFKDGNQFNVSPDNLMAISPREHMKLNVRNMRTSNGELTGTCLNLIRLENAIEEKINGDKGHTNKAVREKKKK